MTKDADNIGQLEVNINEATMMTAMQALELTVVIKVIGHQGQKGFHTS